MAALVSVTATINSPTEKVWECWTNPQHVTNWNFASDDWHCPKAENNLVVEGKFSYRMEAKDGTMGFDFSGKFTLLDKPTQIQTLLDDNRKVEVFFFDRDGQTIIQENFEAETENSIELQKQGWQAILNNFKGYCELSNK